MTSPHLRLPVSADFAPTGAIAAAVAVHSARSQPVAAPVSDSPSSGADDVTAAAPGWRRHGALSAILLLGVICAFDAGIVTALLTPIKASLLLSDESFGRIAACFTIAGIIGAPIFAFLAGRFGRKPVLIGGVLLWSVASSSNALAAGVGGLMIWRALTGFGEAAYQGLAPSWISDLYGKDWRNFVFSLYMVRNKLGSALALAVGSWLAMAFDWRVAFLVSGIPGVALALLFIFIKEPAPGASDGVGQVQSRRISIGEQLGLLRVPAYSIHLSALAFFFSGTAIAQMWAPAFLHRVFGLSNPAASGFLATVLLLTTPVGLVGGYLVGKYLGRYRSGLALALATTSMIAGLAFATAFLSRDLSVTKTFIIIAITAFGSTAGSLTTLMVETVPPHLRATAGLRISVQ